jgi:hypothetical protein
MAIITLKVSFKWKKEMTVPSIERALFSTTKSDVQSSRESNYFFVEFCAALIILPALSLSFLTDFMFPTATDRFMSRTAILPSGGISTNV